MTALRRWLPLLLVLTIMLVAVNVLTRRPVKVEVITPSLQELAEVLALSGRVRGIEESHLAPEVSGTLRKLLVSEGQRVKAGDKLAELDKERLVAQLEQAQERVRVARAQLEIARRGPLPDEIEMVRAEVQGQRLSSEAALESARQRLLEANRGPRKEQVEQARSALREAAAESEQKSREAARQARLVAQGAVSSQAAEQARTAAQRAEQSRIGAQARLTELETGTRPEQIEQARQAVAAAEADFQAAREAGTARLQAILELPRAEDVALAQAQVEEALSSVKIAQQQLRQSEILAPYDGVVGRRLLRVGDLAGPSVPVLTFSSQPALEIRVDVDESDRGRLVAGQQAEIRANGFSESFTAELAELAPEIDTLRGTQEARLRPLQAPPWLIPGQTVDVNLILSEQKERLVVPLTCVVLRGESAEVMVLEGDVARVRPVEISNPTQQGYLIRSGLSGQERIILYPQGIVDGQKVRT